MNNKKSNKFGIKVDRFYNLIKAGGTDYSDNLSEIIDEISAAKEKGGISDAETSMLIKLALMIEYQKEIQGLNEWMKVLNENQESSSALINFSQKERKYA